MSVDPCIPEDFGDFKITRKFRGVTYDITVKTNGVQKGVKELVVDGVSVNGTVIPYDASKKGSHVAVEVVMG